jgi:class 3 adenylate cyclase/tetratricopeptide (TPR) repeat protein
MRQERKVVTVLFCDLVGFTSRAEEMDPEDVAALLVPYQARLKTELERYGGTVEKFIGDAVMALFGAPTAHEDDPERAVRAALAIRDFAEDEGLELRIGITTGEALINVEARPNRGETMATGDVINTAARLQSAAPVNGVLVGEATHRATRAAIEYEEREPVEAKGKAHPVAVWRALAARGRITLERMHDTQLVGRQQELMLLQGALTRARQELAPQLVTIVGVPGIGKSRLVFELFQLVHDDPELITWRQGRCLPYGDGVTFWALGEIVKAQAGILETDSPVSTEAKLETLTGDEWVRSHLRPLVGLGAEEELASDRRGEAFAAWRRFLEELAAERPLVVVFEDLHWADETLLDFVDNLVEWAGGVAILVACTARPELLERRPGWGGGKENALTLSLSPLSDDDTARVVAELLGQSVLPAETQQALLVRAGGNPLYAEQFARMLAEGGRLDGAAIPETVQGLVAARLDLLSPDEKTLLQDAAVLGRTFWSGGLRSLAPVDANALDDRLHSLERKQFIRRERESAVAGEDQHSFRHVLVRDVAYAQIPRAARAEKHQLTAKWIESLGRAEDHAELLAHHYLQALELTRAAGGDVSALAERARVALRAAGDRALALSAFPSATVFYGAALELSSEHDLDRPQLTFRYGSSLRYSERGQPVLESAFDELLAAGDRETAAEAKLMLAPILWHAGNRDGCFEQLEVAERLLRGTGTTRAKTLLLTQLARYRMLAGEEDAVPIGEEAIRLAEELGLDEMKVSALTTIGSARWEDDLRGIQELEEAIALAEAINSAEVVRAYTNLAVQYVASLGDLPRAVEANRRGIEEAHRFGDELGLRFLLGNEMANCFVIGDWDSTQRLAADFIAQHEEAPHYHDAAALGPRRGRGSSRSGAARARARRHVEPDSPLPGDRASASLVVDRRRFEGVARESSRWGEGISVA